MNSCINMPVSQWAGLQGWACLMGVCLRAAGCCDTLTRTMSDFSSTSPRAERSATEVSVHGRTRVDPYAWLRDPAWRDAMLDPGRLSREIREYLEAENAWTEAFMAPVQQLREKLFTELRGRIKEDDATVPAPDGDFAYFTRYREGGEHPLVCRRARDRDVRGPADRDASGRDRAGHDADDHGEILLDGDFLARDSEYFELGTWAHSPDHRLIAWAEDRTGAELFCIRIQRIDTGEAFAETLCGALPNLAWDARSESLFYTVHDENHRPRKILRHVVGTDPAQDPLVYEETDPGFFVSVERSLTGRFVFVHCNDHTTDEYHVIDAHEPDAEPRCFAARKPGIEYEVHDGGDAWIVRTNEAAPDYRIMRAAVAVDELPPGRDEIAPRHTWREFVPHNPGRMIHELVCLSNFVVRTEVVDAVASIVIRPLDDSGDERTLSFDEPVYWTSLEEGFEFDTSVLRFTYSSLTTPQRVYDEDLVTGERILRKEQEIPSGHDRNAYISERLYATAEDGEAVPLSLVYRRGTTPRAQTPVLLGGYGAYGIVAAPRFSPHRFSLVDRGFIVAIAHVRGGRDRGSRWYEGGKLDKKTNTFGDFIAAAEHLQQVAYGSSSTTAIQGGSAGGMLIGAVLNMRPELFGAAVAEVPFVDVLNTMLDDTLPLTPPEWPEWGNPIESEADYERIASYSPYDNVREQRYPPLLVTAGVSDPRVTYWEPAKWVARLRVTKTDSNPLLLHTNMSAGHAGPGGRFEYLRELALRFAFVLRIIAEG